VSQTVSSIKQQKYEAGDARVDMKLEVALIPVSDVDRAKEFYTKLGCRLDADDVMGNDFRIVQLTPPGLGLLGLVRQGGHIRGAWRSSGWADRHRRCGSPQGARSQGHQRE